MINTSQQSEKIVLGIETSCDETAVGIVRANKEILANIVLSQLAEHKEFGGVVPEIAARSHMDHIDRLIELALQEAEIKLSDVTAIAATCGPGLIGGVMVGMMAGKALAASQYIPFIAVNHLEAHALTARLTSDVAFPYLVLLVSGGHTQLLVAESVGSYKRLGTTLDDALGECFDKSAKMMGLEYPGGPNLEKMAEQCDDKQKALEQFPLPRPMAGRDGCDFSFSGLKTSVRQHIDKMPEGDLDPISIARLAYAFQITVGEILRDRCENAVNHMRQAYNINSSIPFVICGGVAANKHLRKTLLDFTESFGAEFIAPPVKLCSDNGLMIAWTGMEKLNHNMVDSLDIAARPRWPLDPGAEKKIGAGVKA